MEYTKQVPCFVYSHCHVTNHILLNYIIFQLTIQYFIFLQHFHFSQTVGVDADASGKGVTLSLRKVKGQNKPGKSLNKTTLRGGRHSIKVIRNAVSQNGYRKDLADVSCFFSLLEKNPKFLHSVQWVVYKERSMAMIIEIKRLGSRLFLLIM